jgi:hypothetical protein
MWLIANGHFDFRATPDAPFAKRRFVKGGIGEKHTRKSTALGLSRLAADFPQVFGPNEVIIPWERLLKYNRNIADDGRSAGRIRLQSGSESRRSS